jgi:hypothetical protein
MAAARRRTNGRLLTSRITHSLRVLSWVSSAARTVFHFSGGSDGMRINIAVTAGQTGLTLAGATFITMGTCFLGPGGAFLIMRWPSCWRREATSLHRPFYRTPPTHSADEARGLWISARGPACPSGSLCSIP